jgi:predicted permease
MDTVYYHEISPNYFHTMGIPLLSGRDFTVRDDSHVPRILIVTESFAKRYWPGESAVGKRIKFGPADSDNPWMEIVGVVGDIRYRSLRQDPEANPIIYAPLEQSEVIEGMSLMARTRGDPESMIAPLRQAIQQYDSEVPVYHIATVEQRIAEQGGETRAYASLLAFFAFLALVLSAVGVYGVMSYAVAQRTHEIGIRMALGAQPGGVLGLVLAESLKVTLAGLALGAAGAWMLTRLLAGLLFGVGATDPMTFATGSLLLAAVALAACYIPARRAMRVDPMVALRHE